MHENTLAKGSPALARNTLSLLFFPLFFLSPPLPESGVSPRLGVCCSPAEEDLNAFIDYRLGPTVPRRTPNELDSSYLLLSII
jgi:hypothetical protein